MTSARPTRNVRRLEQTILKEASLIEKQVKMLLSDPQELEVEIRNAETGRSAVAVSESQTTEKQKSCFKEDIFLTPSSVQLDRIEALSVLTMDKSWS